MTGSSSLNLSERGIVSDASTPAHLAPPSGGFTASTPTHLVSLSGGSNAFICANTAAASSGPTVDVDSLELLHQWYTSTVLTLTIEPEQHELWRTTAINHALSHPFLLRQMLAMAALHMATCRPEKQDWYTTRATELQNDALNRFHEVEVTDESNCIAVLLFSSLLGVHLIADRSRTRGIASSEYLDHMLGCIGLLRGVMKLVLVEWTPFFMASEIGALMKSWHPQPPYDSAPVECRDLNELIRGLDLGPSSIAAYETALDRLLCLMVMAEVPSVSHNTARWVIGWPVQLPDEYIMFLNQRRPEALIILAYYGVVLHFYREAWAIGDTGERLIRAINAQVGSFWRRWLAWPLQLVESSSPSAHSATVGTLSG